MWPKTEKSYQIYIKKLCWKIPITIEICLIDFSQKLNSNDKNFLIEKLSIYGFKVKDINSHTVYKLICPKYFDVCYIDFHLVTLINSERIGIIEIVDFCVSKKYRSKGIGSQFIKILEKIGSKNNIDYIVGDLEDDREDEPLEQRKKFYIKNEFILKKSKLSKFSGVIAIKNIRDIILL